MEPSSLYLSKKQGTGAKAFQQSTEFVGSCFSCGKVGHRQRDCPLSVPPPEATSRGKATSSVITVSESLSQLKPQDPSADQCTQLGLASASA